MHHPPSHGPNGLPHPDGSPTGGQVPYPQGPPPQGPQGHPAGPYQPGPPPGQPPYGHPQGGHPYPGFGPQGQPPYGPGQPPYGPGQPPYGPGQPPYGPPQGSGGGMSKGAKIALIGGAATLVLLLVAGTVVTLTLGPGSDGSVPSASDDGDRDEDDGGENGGGADDATLSSASDGESEVFEGSGDEVIELDPPHADPQILTVEGDGDGMVAVTVVSEDGDQVGYASSMREDDGTRTIYNHRGYDHEIVELDVRSSADSWTLTVEPLDSLDPWTDPDEPMEGSGRDVVLVDWDTSGVDLEMEHDGTSNFIVWGGNPDDGVTDLLANEIGESDLREELSAGTTVLEIDADGDWVLTPA